jgi:hypothetical protein
VNPTLDRKKLDPKASQRWHPRQMPLATITLPNPTKN